MRHKVKRISLGKDSKHCSSLLRNLAQGFIRYERIKTTKAKARVFRSFMEKLITRAKVDNLNNRRLVFRDIKNTNLLKKLFENIAKRYLKRAGGYTRTYKLTPRIGDASEMCIIELVPEFMESDKTDHTSAQKTEATPKKSSPESSDKSSTKFAPVEKADVKVAEQAVAN